MTQPRPAQPQLLPTPTKTTSAGADYGTFSRQAASLNYHVSAAWYCHLAGLNGLPPCRFYWIVVETSAPFAVAVYEIHPDALDLGDQIALGLGVKPTGQELKTAHPS
jgi:hypothetical protein